MLPDLTVDYIRVDYGSEQDVILTPAIRNNGVVSAAHAMLFLRLGHPLTGTRIAHAAPGLEAGIGEEIEFVWDASECATGRHHVYAVADPYDALTEANEENNTTRVEVALLPDLALRATAVVTGVGADGTQGTSIWVFNEGQRDATGARLGLYDRMPVSGTKPMTSTVMNVPVGEHRVANLDLGAHPWGFYADVGMDQTVKDRDISNNVVRVGEVPRFVYLPLVLRSR